MERLDPEPELTDTAPMFTFTSLLLMGEAKLPPLIVTLALGLAIVGEKLVMNGAEVELPITN